MAGPGPTSSGWESWLVARHLQGPLEATPAFPGTEFEQGPARPFLPISVSTVSLSLVSTPGRRFPLLPTVAAARQPFIRGPGRSSLPPGTQWRPHPLSTQTPQAGRRRAPAALGTGPTSGLDRQGLVARAVVVRRPAAGGSPWPGAPRVSRIQGEGRSQGQQEQRPGVRRATVSRSHQGWGTEVSDRAEPAGKELEIGP